MNAQGWYLDPFRRHEDRWFSDGAPTALVRDDGREANDPPPEAPLPETLVRAVHATGSFGDDLLRVGSR
jgi:hypothetical protein